MATHPTQLPQNPSTPQGGDNPKLYSSDFTPKSNDKLNELALSSERGLVEKQKQKIVVKTVGMGGSIFTLVQTTLGSGIITLPYAVYANGIILGPILIIGAAFLSHYTGYLLATASARLDKYTFREIAIATYGRRCSKGINVLIAVDLMALVTAYIVILKSLIPHTIGAIGGDSLPTILTSQIFWATFASYVIVFPLLLMRTVRALQFSSYLGFACIVYLVILVVIQFFLNCDTKQENLKKARLVQFNFKELLASYPMLLFSYFYQTMVPSTQRELRNHTLPRMNFVLIAFIAIATIVYITFSMFGYLTFVQMPWEMEKKNLLETDTYASRVECQIAFIFFTFVIFMACAVNFKPAKDAFQELLLRGRRLTGRGNFCITLSLLTICYCMALLVPIISDAIQVRGCTTSPVVYMILPILFYLKTEKKKSCCKRILPITIIVLMIGTSILAFLAFIFQKLEIEV